VAAFGKPEQNTVTMAALLGAIMPDLSLYIMGGFALYVMSIAPEIVFDELYFSDAWQRVFAIDNSFVLWGLALGVALWLKSRWAVAFAGAALLHIAFDFPLHNEDARMHFWPLSTWKFYSPLSYWDSSSGGRIVGVIEIAVILALVVYLLGRFKSWQWRAVFGGLAALQLVPFFAWFLFF
ncbi:MAG: cobalamin biosynthesis protein CobQ, partial [Pseudomonadota bacterium]